MALDQKLLEDLKAKHGSAFPIHIPETEFDAALDVAVRRPPRGEWKRYRAMLFDEAQRADALETLTKACVVHPSAEEFAALLNDRPALVSTIGNIITEKLAGAGGEAEVKKA